jgi:hypothetical protein
MTDEIQPVDNYNREINDARDRIKSRMANTVQDCLTSAPMEQLSLIA